MLHCERRQIVIFVVAGALATGFVLLRYFPLRKDMQGLEEARREQKASIAKAAAEAEQLPVLKEELVELQAAVGDYEVKVPAARELGVFLQQIASLMSEQSLGEQQVQPGEEVQAGSLNCIPINIHCKGDMKRIFEFFKSLQKLERCVRIEQVKITNGRNFSGQASLDTKAVIYYRAKSG